jgi:hypothetical protein
VIFPHNLRIADYAIGLPGSVHDASAFQKTRVARHPEEFFNNNEWLWADSAYASQTWCVTPFKKPVGGRLGQDKRTFNRNLSTVRVLIFLFESLLIIIKVQVQTEHFYGSLKGCFQSLLDLRFQIQTQAKLDYAITWVRCCLILPNLIIEIEEELGVRSSITEFEQEMRGRDPRRGNQEEESSEEEPEVDDGLAHSTGQAFR